MAVFSRAMIKACILKGDLRKTIVISTTITILCLLGLTLGLYFGLSKQGHQRDSRITAEDESPLHSPNPFLPIKSGHSEKKHNTEIVNDAFKPNPSGNDLKLDKETSINPTKDSPTPSESTEETNNVIIINSNVKNVPKLKIVTTASKSITDEIKPTTTTTAAATTTTTTTTTTSSTTSTTTSTSTSTSSSSDPTTRNVKATNSDVLSNINNFLQELPTLKDKIRESGKKGDLASVKQYLENWYQQITETRLEL